MSAYASTRPQLRRLRGESARLRWPGVAYGMLLCLLSRPARGQNEEPAVVATARALAVAGVQLADAGRCDEALLKLQRAEEIHHAPVVLYYIGACHIRMGRLVQGTEILRGLLRESPPTPANPAVDEAYRHAASLLDETRPKIATLTVLLDAPRRAVPSVTLDGQPLAAVMLGVPRAIDPGEHNVEAHAGGTSAALQKVIVAPGQTRVVALSLTAAPGAAEGHAHAPVSTAAGPAQPLPPAPAPLHVAELPRSAHGPDSPPSHLPAYVAWGVGAGALVVGTAYGWVALRGSTQLDQRCPQRMCPPQEQSRLASERNHATISTVAFALAAAGAVTGTVLYLTAGSDSEARPSTAMKATRATARSRPPPARANLSVGLQGVALRLRF